MGKNLSMRERKRRELLNNHKSLSNKMHGINLIWWESLNIRAQYSILFRWMSYKKSKRKIKIKHFLKSYKGLYNPGISKYRETLINHIIN